MSAVISQISWSFTLIHRNNISSHRRFARGVAFRSKVVMSSKGYNSETYGSRKKANLSYAADLSVASLDDAAKSYTTADEISDENIGGNDPVKATEQKRTAKIHDFCLGIPYGAFVLTGGILGSILSRSLVSLGLGVVVGGGLLALSTISLKTWREGQSSLPFILGQAAVSAALFWKSFQAYTLMQTGKTFSSGLYAAVSAAMMCFYAYVVLSGGNPPPKKLKSAAKAAL